MDIITIFQALSRWGLIALAGGAAVLAILAGAYLVYKKAYRGKRTITKLQAVCVGLLFCWLILVFCLTSLSRGSNFSGSLNIDFLSGYRSAWNHWSVSELQMILFNVLMFAPLGFLLPLVWKKAERAAVTLAASLGVTALIELIQLLLGTGIFELDDLFHNTLGSLFGYFCVMAILSAIREKAVRPGPVARALAIPCLIGLVLGAVFFLYDRQPYGNMSILPAARQDLSEIQLMQEFEPAEQPSTAAVYKNRYALDQTYIRNVKAWLAELEGLSFQNVTRRENENYGYLGKDKNGTDFQLFFFFRTAQWSYTTFTEGAALTEEEIESGRERYEGWMNEHGLLPESAAFSVQNGDTLRWDVSPGENPAGGTEAFQSGSVMIQFDESGALSNFSYQISWNEFVADEEILSESEAYAEVERGNFDQYVPFQPGDVLCVSDCELTYLYDTKGYYQPAYQFSGYLNDEDNLWVCRIPALSR